MIKLLKRSLNRCEKVRSFGGLNTSLEQLGNDGSVVKQHAKTTGHDIHPSCASSLRIGVNTKDKRLFLE